MSEKLFKMPRIMVKSEVLKAINKAASHLSLYDDDFNEDEQCSGYHAFKALCLMKEKLPEYSDWHSLTEEKRLEKKSIPGWYYLRQLHFGLRNSALRYAEEIRKQFKIGNYAEVST